MAQLRKPFTTQSFDLNFPSDLAFVVGQKFTTVFEPAVKFRYNRTDISHPLSASLTTCSSNFLEWTRDEGASRRGTCVAFCDTSNQVLRRGVTRWTVIWPCVTEGNTKSEVDTDCSNFHQQFIYLVITLWVTVQSICSISLSFATLL